MCCTTRDKAREDTSSIITVTLRMAAAGREQRKRRGAPQRLTAKNGESDISSDSDLELSESQLTDPLHIFSSCDKGQPIRPTTPTNGETLACGVHKKIGVGRPNDFTKHLYSYDEIPDWIKGNPFIRHGYRAGYTMNMCLQSIFMLHNETANVWTHLLGMLFFLTCSILFFANVMQPMLIHYLVLVPFSAALVLCMGLSAAYHLFSAHYCQHVCDRMMQLDYFGITCLVVGSFLPPCYFGFQCAPQLRVLYLSMIGVLGSVGLVGPFFGFWAQPHFYRWRLFIYCSTAFSGIFPIVHINFVIPNGAANPYVTGLALMMMFYSVGTIVYVFKIPERFFPGRFDIWLHSHQIWHVFVLCAALVHFFNSGSMYTHLEPMEVHC